MAKKSRNSQKKHRPKQVNRNADTPIIQDDADDFVLAALDALGIFDVEGDELDSDELKDHDVLDALDLLSSEFDFTFDDANSRAETEPPQTIMEERVIPEQVDLSATIPPEPISAESITESQAINGAQPNGSLDIISALDALAKDVEDDLDISVAVRHAHDTDSTDSGQAAITPIIEDNVDDDRTLIIPLPDDIDDDILASAIDILGEQLPIDAAPEAEDALDLIAESQEPVTASEIDAAIVSPEAEEALDLITQDSELEHPPVEAVELVADADTASPEAQEALDLISLQADPVAPTEIIDSAEDTMPEAEEALNLIAASNEIKHVSSDVFAERDEVLDLLEGALLDDDDDVLALLEHDLLADIDPIDLIDLADSDADSALDLLEEAIDAPLPMASADLSAELDEEDGESAVSTNAESAAVRHAHDTASTSSGLAETTQPTQNEPKITEPDEDILPSDAELEQIIAEEFTFYPPQQFDDLISAEPAANTHLEEEFPEETGYLTDLITEINAHFGGSAQNVLTPIEQRLEVEPTEATVVFRIGETLYGIPIQNVLEVSELQEITPLPFVPHWLAGITNLRGDILSLVDLGEFLNLKATPNTAEQWILVVETSNSNMVIGLIVEDVIGHRQLRTSDRIQLTHSIQDNVTPYIHHLYTYHDNLVTTLDCNKLLQSPAMQQFQPA